MSKVSFNFSVDLELGEARVTPSAERNAQSLIEDSPLLALDVFGDVVGLGRYWYAKAWQAHVAKHGRNPVLEEAFDICPPDQLYGSNLQYADAAEVIE